MRGAHAECGEQIRSLRRLRQQYTVGNFVARGRVEGVRPLILHLAIHDKILHHMSIGSVV